MLESNESTQMFQAMVELTDAIHWEMDLASGRFTYVSPQIEKILGYPPGKWNTFAAWADTLHPDDREYAVNFCQQKTADSEDHILIYRVLNAAGEIVWLQDVVKVISKDGKPVKLFGVMFDITEQKRAEAGLKTHAIILQNVTEGVCLIGEDELTIKWVNPALENMFGYKERELRGNPLDVLMASIDLSPEDSRTFMAKLLKDTGRWQGDARGIRKDDVQFWCHLNIFRVDHPEHGNVYVFVFADITERKQAEESLKESESKYRAIISSSPIGIVVCDADGQAMSTNRAMADIVGATEEQILKQNYHNIESWKGSGLYDTAIRAVRTGRTERIDTELVSSFGKKIYLSAHFTPLGSGELLAMMQDISELLLTQKELARALHDKSLLMKEVQHRTKNNLFILQSLLSLQARKVSDEQARAHFADAKNRVTSMTLIYEMLNRADDVRKMNSAVYIRKLIDTLYTNLRIQSRAIALQYDIEDVTLDSKTLIPLGLIINELVTNALKYAFPDEREGTLSVSLKTTGQGAAAYELVIKDNGVGLPEDFDIKKITSLGLEIVRLLVGQIKGTLDVFQDKGVEFRIRFAEKVVG